MNDDGTRYRIIRNLSHGSGHEEESLPGRMAGFCSNHVFDKVAAPAILLLKLKICQEDTAVKRFNFRICVFVRNSTPVGVEEVTLDDPQDHEVLLKLATAETFHVDLHFVKGEIRVPTPKTHYLQSDLPPSSPQKRCGTRRLHSSTGPPFLIWECRPRICQRSAYLVVSWMGGHGQLVVLDNHFTKR